MKVYVLMFGFEYEGYDNEVEVFASRDAAVAEGERKMGDEDGITYDYYDVIETNVIG
jgi:hypothetical protein